jgi:hypothetical protein
MLGHRLEPSDLTVLSPQPCMPKDLICKLPLTCARRDSCRSKGRSHPAGRMAPWSWVSIWYDHTSGTFPNLMSCHASRPDTQADQHPGLRTSMRASMPTRTTLVVLSTEMRKAFGMASHPGESISSRADAAMTSRYGTRLRSASSRSRVALSLAS